MFGVIEKSFSPNTSTATAARVFKRRDLDNRVYASDEAREYATRKAEEVEAGLDPKFPTMVKPMLQSHTTGGFWLVRDSHD